MRSVILKKKKLLLKLLLRFVQWHGRYYLTRRPLPLSAGLYITSRCTLKCGFCTIRRREPPATLPFEKARSIVENLSRLGCCYFSISGGEPLMVDYLDELLQCARESRIGYLHLVTNGFLLDGLRAEKLGKTGIDEVSVSLDGSRTFHDNVRGVDGSYYRAVQAVENIKRYAPGVSVVINAVVHPQRPDECLKVLELAHQLDVYLKVQPLNQHPLINHDDHSLVSWEGVSPFELKRVIGLLVRDDRVVNSSSFLQNMYNFFFCREKLAFSSSPCLFGYHHMEFLQDGSVYPCLEGMNWSGGLSFDDDLEALLFSRNYRKMVSGLRKCRGCHRNYYICYYEPRFNFPIHHLLRSLMDREVNVEKC